MSTLLSALVQIFKARLAVLLHYAALQCIKRFAADEAEGCHRRRVRTETENQHSSIAKTLLISR